MKRIVTFEIALVLLLFGVAAPVRGDAGFKLGTTSIRVWITVEGKPLDAQEFSAALLEVRPEGKMRAQPYGSPARLPAFQKFLDSQSGSDRLAFCSYSWGGRGTDGQVHFWDFRGDMPEQVRLLVVLPGQQQPYLTEVAIVDAPIRHFHADLTADAGGKLEPVRLPFWHSREFFRAIGLTLGLELAVVAFVARRRQWPVRRLLIVSCVGSLLTLPVVWFVMLIPYTSADYSLASLLGFFAGAELGAVVFEGLLFAWLGRLGLQRGFALALVANLVSMSVGLVI